MNPQSKIEIGRFMTNEDAFVIINGTEERDEDKILQAWQHIADTGLYTNLPLKDQMLVKLLIDVDILKPINRN